MQNSLFRLGCSTARHCRFVLASQQQLQWLQAQPNAATVGGRLAQRWALRSPDVDSLSSNSPAVACSRRFRGLSVLASSASDGEALRLVIYSRDDCPLCDGLKEKVDLAIEKAQYLQSPLTGATVEVRDISTNPEWQAQYALTIPVLKVVAPSTGQEVEVKRAPPRASSDRVAQNILAALEGAATP